VKLAKTRSGWVEVEMGLFAFSSLCDLERKEAEERLYHSLTVEGKDAVCRKRRVIYEANRL